MNNIAVITELCQEDRNRVDTLIAIGLELVNRLSDVQPEAPAETRQEELEGQMPLDDAPTTEEAPVSGKLGDKGNEKLFSAVQQKVVKLSAAGKEKKAAVREIVQQFATKVSDIPAEEYDTVMAQLAALEG